MLHFTEQRCLCKDKLLILASSNIDVALVKQQYEILRTSNINSDDVANLLHEWHCYLESIENLRHFITTIIQTEGIERPASCQND